ncbi:hypothetical protein GCM10010140_62500 [Streptosporangium pseudovulgare]|uniref:DNA-binding protein n=1 Tax=Streptosporangium pseudovulgare TaxID=35765 RepID=A0ABQ2RF10_9ACTN|nr:hypothetical protein GCM10010140_62500 [Streptosporangium pseudovulgare]
MATLRSDDKRQRRPHKIAPGFFVLVPAEMTVSPGDGVGPYQVRLVIDVAGGRLGCTELTVTAQDGTTISSAALRGVPVASIVRSCARNLVMEGHEGEGVITLEPHDVDVDVSAGPTDEALRAVAASYSLAYALGEPPAKGVERELGLATSTAGRWIKLARERGFLEIPAEKGRRA